LEEVRLTFNLEDDYMDYLLLYWIMQGDAVTKILVFISLLSLIGLIAAQISSLVGVGDGLRELTFWRSSRGFRVAVCGVLALLTFSVFSPNQKTTAVMVTYVIAKDISRTPLGAALRVKIEEIALEALQPKERVK
jgi:ABC-type antimicrobial peptide transport system permease subunit